MLTFVSNMAILLLRPGVPIGSDFLDALVALTFIATIVSSCMMHARTFAGTLAKWLLLIFCVAMIVATAVYRFGSPLAGVGYWMAVRTLGVAWLPVCAITLIVAWS